MSKLNVQFEKGIQATEMADLLDNIRRAGATDVRPLFPGALEPDLATLYVVECEDQRRIQVLLSTAYPVRYVEEQVSRKQPARPRPGRRFTKPRRPI